MRAALGLLLLTLLLPAASAQVPEAPDPTQAIDLACAALGGAAPDARDVLPVCPRVEPAAPQATGEEQAADHQHAGEGPAAAPERAQGLAAEAADAAREIPEDPASAPDRLAGLLATVVQAVRDLLQLPVAAAASVAAGFGDAHATLQAAAADAVEAGAALRSGAEDAVERTGEAIRDAAAKLASLFERADVSRAPDTRLDLEKAAPAEAAEGLLRQVRAALPRP